MRAKRRISQTNQPTRVDEIAARSDGERSYSEIMRCPLPVLRDRHWGSDESVPPAGSVSCSQAAGELLRRDVPGSQRGGVLFTAGKMRRELWSDFLECVRTG
jgi:hypothetical protein